MNFGKVWVKVGPDTMNGGQYTDLPSYTCALRGSYSGFRAYPWTPVLSGLSSTYLTLSRCKPKPPPNAMV